MFLRNQDEFGTNCAVDKCTKISMEIRLSADIQKVKYRPVISVDRYIGRSLHCTGTHFCYVNVQSCFFNEKLL